MEETSRTEAPAEKTRTYTLAGERNFVDVLDRLLVSLVSLVVLAGAVITILVALDVLEPDVLGGWFQSPLESAATSTGGEQALYIAIPIIVGLAMLGLLLMQFITGGQRRALMISSTNEGLAMIDRDSVRTLAERTAASNRDVRNVRCDILDRDGSLEVVCRTTVYMGSNLPEVSADLQRRIKEVVEYSVGLPVAHVDVQARYETATDRRRRPQVT